MFLIMLQMLSISITLKAFAKLVKKSYEYVNLLSKNSRNPNQSPKSNFIF
jgi:hypothetical protein